MTRTRLALTTTEAAELFGVSRWTIVRWINAGRLARIPGSRLVSVAELERFASERAS